jgi:hypothetical protein
LAHYSKTIQGASPLIYAGVIPTTFIEGEIRIKLSENFRVIDLSHLGISGYDIYKIKLETKDVDFPQTEWDSITETWNNWILDKDEITMFGTDEKDKIIGKYSLWFDVKPSNKSNTWIRYGNWDLHLDLSKYNTLVFYIKANVSLSWQHNLGGGTAIFIGSGNLSKWIFLKYDFNITTDWQRVIIPFDSFKVVGKPSLTDINYIIISVHAVPGSPSYRIWIDGLSFLNIEGSSVYCNGLKVNLPFTSSTIEIDDVWAWADIYGYNQKDIFRNKIILAKSGSAEPNITLFVRLHPKSFSYYGLVNFTDWSGTTIDSYVWDNLTSIVSLLQNMRLVVSVSKNTYYATVNNEALPLNTKKSTIYLYKEHYPLENVLTFPLIPKNNYTLQLYSKTSWISALFYSMSRALWMLQRFRGANYPIFMSYLLISTIEVFIFILKFNKQPSQETMDIKFTQNKHEAR